MLCLLCFIPKDCRRLEKEIIKPFYIMAKGYENSDIMLENRKIPMLWNDSLYTVRAMFLRTACMQSRSSESLCPRLQSRSNLSLTTFHPFIFTGTSCRWELTWILWSFSHYSILTSTQSTFCKSYPIHKIMVLLKVKNKTFSVSPGLNIFLLEMFLPLSFIMHINNTVSALLLICFRPVL